jgi:replicative DNA helicase
MSTDKPKVPDENELLQQGKLSPNPAQGTRRVEMVQVVDSRMRKIGEPSAVPSEAALLGALLWAAANSPESLRASQVVDILPDGSPFYVREYGQIYTAMLACLAKNEETGHMPVEHDPVAVAQHAASLGFGSDKTGIDALLKLQAAASTVSEVQARAYAEAIKAAWVKREAIRQLRLIVSDALDPRVNDVEIYERAQKVAMEIMDRSSAKSSTVSIKQSAAQLFTDLKAPGGAPIATGLRDLDLPLNGGLRAPETSIIAARTSVGKSTISIGIGEHVCMSDPLAGVLYVSMEMPHKSFTTKLLAARTPGVTTGAIRRKSLSTAQWQELQDALNVVKDLELHFTVSMTQTLASVFAAANDRQRELKKRGKHLALVIIDHVGLVKASSAMPKNATRQQQVAETSRGMRWIATELGCHVMGLAQIHRDAERQKDTESIPKLHHLRESGDLEQDADSIMILHRPRNPSSGVFIKDKPAALVLAKSRMDETAGILLDFYKGRYVNWDDTTKTFKGEYEDKGQNDHGKGAPFAPNRSQSAPPPQAGKGKPIQASLPGTDSGNQDQDVIAQIVVQYVVDAVADEVEITELRRLLGASKNMSIRTVDRGIEAAVAQGLLSVTGEGNGRRVRRIV